MKRYIMTWIILLVLILSSCTEVSLQYLDFELLPGHDTIDINEGHIDQGAEAYYGLKRLDVIVLSNNVDSSKEGVYEIIYQTTHRELVQTLVRKVTVKDQTPPQATLNPGIDTIMLGDVWHDAGITTFDNSGGDVEIEVLGAVLAEIGRYTIIYRITDPSKNVTEITRIVYVIDLD